MDGGAWTSLPSHALPTVGASVMLQEAGAQGRVPGACSVVMTVVVIMVDVVVSWLSSEADPVSSFSPLSIQVMGLASSRGASWASSGTMGSPESGFWGSVWAMKGCEVKGEICRGAGVVGTAPRLRSSPRGSSDSSRNVSSPAEATGSGALGGPGFSVAEEGRPRPGDAGWDPTLRRPSAEVALGRSCFLDELACLSEDSFLLGREASWVLGSSGSSVDRATGSGCTEGVIPSSSGSGRSSLDCAGLGGAGVTFSSRLSLLRRPPPSAPEGRR